MSKDDTMPADTADAAATHIPITDEDEPYRLVVTFEKQKDAEEAIRVINRALRKQRGAIQQGALVTREGEDERLTVRDLHDTGLLDVAREGFDIALDTGREGARLVWSTVGAGFVFLGGGWRLVRGLTRRSLGLLGTTWTIPRRRRLDAFAAAAAQERDEVELEPGETAVVLVADRETAARVATDLVRKGGEIA